MASSRILFAAFALVVLLAPANAVLEEVMNGVGQLCFGMTNLLPVASMLMVTLGAVVYASGQIMGAETRARANVWATAALTGAVTALLIASVSPPVLASIYPGMRTDCSFVCRGTASGTSTITPPGGTCCVTKCNFPGSTCGAGWQWVCNPSKPLCAESTGGIGHCCISSSGLWTGQADCTP